jgi:hypothetical protein
MTANEVDLAVWRVSQTGPWHDALAIATAWLRPAQGWGRSLPRGFRFSGRSRPCDPGPLATGARGCCR